MTKEPSNRSGMNGGETRSRTVWFLAHDLCPFLSLARLEEMWAEAFDMASAMSQ